MKHVLRSGVSATAILLLGSMVGASPAMAQDATAMQAIQKQIQQLQIELRKLQAASAARDAELRRAQEQARAAQAQAAAAQAAASTASTAATTTAAQVAALPPPQPVAAPGPQLPPGTFRIGGATVTLGGFAALEGIDRSRNQGGTIATNFNGTIPFASSPNYHTPEFRLTAQQSRVSLLVQAPVDSDNKLSSYLETDFLSAGTSSNNNQSNSYTLRLRQFFGEWDNSALGLHVEGGQGWSLATMYKNGLLPRQENVPLTIDAQYVAGFDWARQAELRVVKDWNQQYWAALSIEEPATIFGSSGGPNCLTGANATSGIGGNTLEYTTCGGSNANTIQAYSDNYAPDVIAKLAADPGYGHYEVYGLLRFLGGRVSNTGYGHNYNTTGEGVGAAALLPVIPKLLDFQVSGLYGKGVGRYGTAQIADVTFNPYGKIEPLSGQYSVMGGVVAHPTPEVDVYAYGGAEGTQAKAYTVGTVYGGYGNPNVSLAGCLVELGSCSAVTSGVVEGTIGAWYRVLKGAYGTVQLGAQYEYVRRNAFEGAGATKGSTVTPHTDENAFLFSVRYYPFQ